MRPLRRLLRQPTRFLLLWTAICAVPVYSLVATAVEESLTPPPGDCMEWCNAGFAWWAVGYAVPIIFAVWLTVTLLVLSGWHRSG
jgi:hypothetical protein